MARVYLALGSNVGDSRAHIEQAIQLLKDSLDDVQVAPFYLSKAVGYTDQPDFTNTVVVGSTDLEPLDLLQAIKDIEKRVGRTPSFHWGPREIDIDIIFYDDQVLKTEQLTIPHPAFVERDFVLRPLCDLNPDLIDPLTHQTISELLARLNQSQKSILHKIN